MCAHLAVAAVTPASPPGPLLATICGWLLLQPWPWLRACLSHLWVLVGAPSEPEGVEDSQAQGCRPGEGVGVAELSPEQEVEELATVASPLCFSLSQHIANT